MQRTAFTTLSGELSKNVNESNYQFKLQGLVDRMQYGKYGKDGK